MMEQFAELSLDGEWLMIGVAPGYRITHEFFEPGQKKEGWTKANIPNTVHSILLKEGKIADPYFDKNNLRLVAIEEKEWWFQKEFGVSSEWSNGIVRLLFEGVDYIATFWINGTLIGKHEGMFGGPCFDVTGALRYGQINTLTVKIDPPPKDWRKTLKTNVMYGWHYVRLVPSGIWRSVKLVRTGSVYFESVCIRTEELTDKEAILSLVVELRNKGTETKAQIKGSIRGKSFKSDCLDFSHPITLKERHSEHHAEIRVPRPRLWWPHGVGDQNLYQIDLSIVQEGRVSDRSAFQFGIRTIEMMPNSGKKPSDYDWTFFINGRKIYVKGANWCTLDAILRLSSDRYHRFLSLAKKVNINMLRAWGGGLIETEEFYDLCDRLGIMVWQEFPLCFGEYQDSSQLSKKVLEEQSEWILRRLRNRACLVMWCGGNEHTGEGEVIDFLEGKCREVDPTRPFHRASPYRGDTHHWSVYHGYAPITDYAGNMRYVAVDKGLFVSNEAPFMSEFGLCCAPSLESIKKYVPQKELSEWPPRQGGAFIHHCPQYGGGPDLVKMLRYATEYGDINNLEEFVRYSQMSAAVAHKVGIEYMRSRMFKSSGTFFYKLTDDYPGCSWSIIDWYGVPKMGYYFVKRAYESIHVCTRYDKQNWLENEEFAADIFVVNDGNADVNDYLLESQILGSDFSVLQSRSKRVNVSSNSSKKVMTVKWMIPERTLNSAPFFLWLELIKGDCKISKSVYWYNFENSMGYKTSNLPHFDNFSSRMGCLTRLPKTHLRLEGFEDHQHGELGETVIRGNLHNADKVPAFCAEMKIPGFQNRVSFTDNYVFLAPGEVREIDIGLPMKGRLPKKIELIASAWNSTPVKKEIDLVKIWPP